MAPDVTFHLSHDAYDQFAELLAPHAITVRDTAHDVHENLKTHSVAIESRSGFLTHQGREFVYRRQKSFPDSSFPWHLMPQESASVRVFREGSLSVTIGDHDSAALERLFAVLELVFPDPPRPQPSPQTVRSWTRFRLFKRLGCSIVLILFAVFCFFAFYGIRAFIRSF